jgi:hypothetical protein
MHDIKLRQAAPKPMSQTRPPQVMKRQSGYARLLQDRRQLTVKIVQWVLAPNHAPLALLPKSLNELVPLDGQKHIRVPIGLFTVLDRDGLKINVSGKPQKVLIAAMVFF